MPPNNGNGTNLVLYYYPYSFYSQKVVMALHQMKIKYQPKYVDTHRGKQFSHAFLALNPKGEVPVLVDDVRVIPDAEKIIDYLQDNFANGNPGLLPKDPEARVRVEQLHQAIQSLKIESLSYGAAMFDDLGISPKPPYSCLTSRTQMRDYLIQRPRVLHAAATTYPLHAATLNKQLQDLEEESKLWRNRDQYEGLLIYFEKVMDECEAELASHDNPGWWIASPEISVADIDLSLLLHRLWQLGFERRMWERNRPNLKRYFARVRMLDSFKAATSLSEGSNIMQLVTSPIFLGIVGGTVALAGGYLLWKNTGSKISAALGQVFQEEYTPGTFTGPTEAVPTKRVSMSAIPIPNSVASASRAMRYGPPPPRSQFS